MMVRRFMAIGAGVLWACTAMAQPAGSPARPAPLQWSFAGVLGYFDLAAVQRGYAVFAGSCASCHSLSQLHFSDFAGMGLQTADVAALSATWQVPDGLDAEGRVKHRPARPDDALPSPYFGPEAALAANQGVLPPDLSRILKVYPGGPDRLYALLTGYGPQVARQKGRGFFNPYAIGHFTAMPPPLHGNEVKYADGTVPDVQAEARDVTTFLAWVSAPHQDQRRRLGVGAGLYLCFLAVLFAILNRRIWSDVRK